MDKEFFTSTKNYKDLFISGVKVSDLMKKYKLNKYDLNSYLPIQSSRFDKSKVEFHFFSYYKKWNFHDIIIM